MDLQTEAIYKEEMSSDPRRFMPLFDENYSGLYRFVSRRIEDENTREQIVRLTVLDAVGQISTCPKDVNFLTWLYRLARERISEYSKRGVGGMGGPIESPIFDGASIVEGVYDDEFKLKQQAESFFAILTYEEKEIVRLKFFEELTDGEVMYVMSFSAGSVGTKIYQVLKRSYEILFGKVDEYAGVYYGELYSFLSRLKAIEKIPVPEISKLKIKAEILNKLEKMYTDKFGKSPAEHHKEARESDVGSVKSDPINVGSSDPAKAFVYAAKGMSKEEVEEITREYVEEREVGKKSETRYESVNDAARSENTGRVEKIDRVEEPKGWQKPEDIWAEKFGRTAEKPSYASQSVPDLEVESGVASVAEEISYVESAAAQSAGVASAESKSRQDRVENIPVQYQTKDEYADEMYDTFVDKFYNFWDKWRAVFQVAITGLIALSVVLITVIAFIEKPTIIDTGVRFAVNYGEGFSIDEKDENERVIIEKNLIAKISEGKRISSADVSKDAKNLNISFNVSGDGILDYVFDIKGDNLFRVKSFKEVNK